MTEQTDLVHSKKTKPRYLKDNEVLILLVVTL